MSDQVTVTTEAELDVVVLETDGNYTVITVGEQGPAGAAYQLPAATANTLGGIIVGSNLSITGNGLLSANIPPGGVTAFNGRTGNVTLTANDVTTVANGIYQANGSYLNDVLTNVNMSYGGDALSGMRKPTGGGNFVAGRVTLGTTGLVGVISSTEASAIEFSLGDIFATLRLRQYAHTLIIRNSGFEVETGTANWSWSANSILTQGRGDARYQPVGSYLTSANLTWSNLTGKPTFATVATSGNYTDLANTPNLSLYYLASNPSGYITAANLTYGNITGTPNLSLYYLANNPSGYITASCLTYSNITGTPNLSLYLTTANAATTYLPSANFSFSNLTGKPTTLSGYGITDGLTSATAAATYQTISGMSSYLTVSSAASIYLPSANFTYDKIGGNIPIATANTAGAIKVGANLSIANGVLSANGTGGGGGGFANGDILNGGTF